MTPKNTPANDDEKAQAWFKSGSKDSEEIRICLYNDGINHMNWPVELAFKCGLREARTESLSEIAKMRTELNKARCGCSSCVAHDEVLSAED